MRAGAARADITPEPGIELAGYAARIQPSLGVHMALHFHGLYLESGHSRLFWLHADLIGFDSKLVRRLRARIGECVGLPPHKIVLSASHTHSGPPTMSLLGCGALRAEDGAYLDRLVECAGDVAAEASERVEEVEVLEGRSTCGIALDRRHRELDMREDPVVTLGFRRGNGEYVAVLANYAIHPVSLNHRNRLVSADLAGVAAEHVRTNLPGQPVVLMTNGACGDLNPATQGGDTEACERIGEELGRAVLAAVGQGHPVDEELESHAIPMVVPVEPMGEDAVRRRAQQVREEQAEKDPVWAAASLMAADEWERRMLTRLPLAPLNLAVQEVRIAGRRFFAFGAEVLSAMRPELEKVFGPRVLVVGYANGNVGYLCPAEAFDEGGYEPDLAFIYYGTPKVARGAFEGVVRQLAERSGG